MKQKILLAVTMVAVLAAAAPGLALNPGTEIFVPAAARATPWVTDMYIFNPGSAAANVSIYWLPRDTDNSSATPVNFTIQPGSTLALPDLISGTFGLDSGAGAFRITSDADVAVNCRIYSTDGSSTFGQGFEGVPASAALSAGSKAASMTDIMGLAQNSAFRSNFFAVNTGSTTATVVFHLMDPSGNELASRSYNLPPYAAFYRNVTDLGGPSFDNGTLHVEVTAGSAIVVGSKVDNASGDPTTLEAWWTCGSGGGSGTVGGDGIYVGYMSYTYIGGLWLVVENNAITYLQGANTLFSPDDGGFNCANVFGWGVEPDTPFAIAGDGTFTANFAVEYQSGYILTFTFDGEMDQDTILGTLDLNVSGAPVGECSGDLNTVPFYTGHTQLVLQ
jgi:hypothetical protein